MKQQAQETKQFIDNQEAEERKLLKIISDADAERLRQKKELDQVRDRERDGKVAGCLLSLRTHCPFKETNSTVIAIK